MRRLRSVMLGLLLVSAAAVPAIAASFYDNGSPDGVSAYISDLTDPVESQLIADNFSLLSSGTVLNVTWWGAYAGNTPVPDTFTIEFYNDLSGAPGTAFFSSLVTAARTSTGLTTGISFSGGTLDLYQYSADVSVALSAGVPYWLVIYNNNTATNNLWVWATTGAANDGSQFAQMVNVWQPLAEDFAFQLNVPEPGTWLLCGLGLAGVALRRRRR